MPLPDPEILAKPVQPDAAIAFWRARAKLTSAQAKALGEGARSRAFYVTGLAEADMVNLVHGGIAEALENGETLADFKKRIAEVIEREGWKGHRVETVFRTSMQSAYSAGRYAKQQAVKELLPFWRYVTVGDSRVRPSHAMLSGKVFPADHPFWAENYPPNGFKCRCAVQALSKGQVRRRGLNVETEIPGDSVWTDPKTGMEHHVARPGADSGFRNNPGKDWLAGLSPQEVPFDAGEDLVRTALCLLPRTDSADFADAQVRRIVGHGQECLPPLITLAPKHILPVKKADILPEGMTEEAYALAFLREFGLKTLDDSMLFRLPWLRMPLIINKQLLLTKATGKYKSDKSGRGPYMRLMAQAIKNPYEVWQVPMKLSGKIHITLRFLRLFRGDDGGFGGYSAFNWIGSGRYWSGATVFKAKNDFQRASEYLEQQRNGLLLFREGGGGLLQK